MNKKKQEDGGYWAFALINGRLAEFHFEISKGKFYMSYGHCYVKRNEYKTKYEQRWIDKDTQKYRFTFRNKKYRRAGEQKILPAKHFRISKKEKMVPLEALLKTTKTS
ncbi:MAG: hypothetical protein Q7R65_03185 [bacterium]|nr:hypothetical protein [bacterium]